MGLLPQFTAITGHPLGRHIVVVLEYGQNYSGPGNDVFKETRATGFAHRAYRSNFLHPVLYYYERPITGEQYCKTLGTYFNRLKFLYGSFILLYSRICYVLLTFE